MMLFLVIAAYKIMTTNSRQKDVFSIIYENYEIEAIGMKFRIRIFPVHEHKRKLRERTRFAATDEEGMQVCLSLSCFGYIL